MIAGHDYPISYDQETDVKILHSGFSDNEIKITTNKEDITIDGDKIAEDIFAVYDRHNIVYVLFWDGYKLKRKEIEYS